MRKATTLLFFCLLFSFSFGQTASERRKAKEKALNDSLMAAQQRQNAAAALRRQKLAEKNNQAVFGDDDPIFKNTEVPDKWSHQSAVILAAKYTFKYYTKGPSAYFDQTERRKIKILDKSAIENLSIFYFLPTDDVGFTVIKKDGSVVKLSTDQAVPVDDYMPLPALYRLVGTLSYYSKAYKKLAVSGLEPGDIIDFYYKYSVTTYKNGLRVAAFPPVMFSLTGDYPILDQKIKLKVEKEFYINFASFNGAPDLVKTDDTSDHSNTFILSGNNLDKPKDEIWVAPYRSQPTIKFQVVYSTEKDKDYAAYFIGKPSIPMSVVPHDLLKAVANQIALENTNTIEEYSSSIIRFMRRYHGDIKDPVLYMRYAYDYFRYFLTIGYVREENESGFSADVYDNIENKPEINSDVFAKTMGLVCRDKKIQYDLLFAVPRNKGTLNSLIYPADIRWVLCVRGNPDTYLYPFDTYKDPGEASDYLEGVDAYVLVPNVEDKKVVMSIASIPSTNDSANRSSFHTVVDFGSDFVGDVTLERKAAITGLSKEPYFPYVINEDKLINEDSKRFKGITDEDYLKGLLSAKKKKEEKRKIAASVVDENADRLERLKDFFKQSFDISTYDDFNLISDGREIDSASLLFNDKFKLKDAVHKAGANYLIDAGKFIGRQFAFTEDQMTRENDIYSSYAEEVINEVQINVPTGYIVDGVSALNVSVITSVGGFISIASLSANTLFIKTRRYYIHNFDPKENWPEILKFVQAAHDFTQKKVLLKKV